MVNGLDSSPTPYVELNREQWRDLRNSTPLTLNEAELERLRGKADEA